MALYRRKRIKDRRGSPPPGFPHENAYGQPPGLQGGEKAPDPIPDAVLNPEHDKPGEEHKKTQ